MQKHPFSQQMLRAAHSVLLQGRRGKEKEPGNYRKTQNWIGPKDCPLEQANFVPVPPEHLQHSMDVWERFFLSNSEPDALVQLALLHVEFEALHPFKDGNGRLGRMLIPLFLYHRKLLSSPDFYMSGYLEANREEYQERLRTVSREGDWTGWCLFFLNGIRQQAANNESKASAIHALYNCLLTQVADLTHSQHVVRAVDFIFQNPVFPGTLFSTKSGIPEASAKRILPLLWKSGVLMTLREAKKKRSGIYAFRELLAVTEGRDIFLAHM